MSAIQSTESYNSEQQLLPIALGYATLHSSSIPVSKWQLYRRPYGFELLSTATVRIILDDIPGMLSTEGVQTTSQGREVSSSRQCLLR